MDCDHDERWVDEIREEMVHPSFPGTVSKICIRCDTTLSIKLLGLSPELQSTVDFVAKPKCGCLGHRMPGVMHIAPCCDEPHITVEEYNRGLSSTID